MSLSLRVLARNNQPIWRVGKESTNREQHLSLDGRLGSCLNANPDKQTSIEWTRCFYSNSGLSKTHVDLCGSSWGWWLMPTAKIRWLMVVNMAVTQRPHQARQPPVSGKNKSQPSDRWAGFHVQVGQSLYKTGSVTVERYHQQWPALSHRQQTMTPSLVQHGIHRWYPQWTEWCSWWSSVADVDSPLLINHSL